MDEIGEIGEMGEIGGMDRPLPAPSHFPHGRNERTKLAPLSATRCQEAFSTMMNISIDGNWNWKLEIGNWKLKWRGGAERGGAGRASERSELPVESDGAMAREEQRGAERSREKWTPCPGPLPIFWRGMP